MAPRGKPFESGNKHGRGRPRGSRNKTTVEAMAILDQYGPSLVKTVVVEALQKREKWALRFCLERLLPARRDLPVKIGKLPVRTADDVSKASETIIEKVAAGKITPSEGKALTDLIEGRRRTIETEGIAARVQALEERKQ